MGRVEVERLMGNEWLVTAKNGEFQKVTVPEKSFMEMYAAVKDCETAYDVWEAIEEMNRRTLPADNEYRLKSAGEIVYDIKKSGYKPTQRLVSGIDRIQRLTGMPCTVKDIKEKRFKEQDASTAKTAALMKKELNRQDRVKLQLQQQQPEIMV